MSIEKSVKLRSGLALADLLACGAMLVVVAAIGVPTLERARELSKRMTCSINLKGIGLACAAYADANMGEWMTPPFKKNTDGEGIAYLCQGPNSWHSFNCIGHERERQSTSETDINPAGGSTAVTTTRAYWMLVRSGEISVKQFICPSSLHDQPDPTGLIDLYYDFQDYTNISYGYLVPFGPSATRPRAGADSRVVFAADKGPFYQNVNLDFMSRGPNGMPLLESHAPSWWQAANSPNHGGPWIGEGQNALHADGHVAFYRKPLAGADSDNIYSLIRDEWGVQPFGRTHGDWPHIAPAQNPYPGQEALGPGPNDYSTTDSLIYP